MFIITGWLAGCTDDIWSKELKLKMTNNILSGYHVFGLTPYNLICDTRTKQGELQGRELKVNNIYVLTLAT